MMFENWMPSHEVKSAFVIDYAQLYARGIRGIIFDIDSTLVPHDADADGKSVGLMKKLMKMGFAICFVSNNDAARVDRFNQKIGAFSVPLASKPSGKGYVEAMRLMGTDKESTIAVGDQVFTDVWGARRAGIECYRVQPIGKDIKTTIMLKRFPEKLVLCLYHLKKRRSRA